MCSPSSSVAAAKVANLGTHTHEFFPCVHRFAKIFSGWVLTLFVAGFVAAAFSAFGVYSPNRFASEYFATVDGSSVMGNHTLRGL